MCPLDSAKLKEKFDKKSAERSDRLNLKDGDNYIRLLPPSIEYFSDSVDYICYDYLIHYQLGQDGNKTSAVCPKTLGKHHKCPACEVVYRLFKTNTAEDKTLANQMRAKTRIIFNVIDLNAVDKGIQILEVGPTVYDGIVVFITNPKWGDLLDIDKGRNVTLTKTPGEKTKSGYVEYSVTPDPDSSSIRKKLPEDYKNTIALLKKAIPTPKSYEEIKAILEGEDPADMPAKDVEHKSIEKEEKVIEEKPKVIEKKKVVEPDCYGKDYGPRREECVSCEVKIGCREKFLEV